MSEKRSTFIYIYLIICIIDLVLLATYPLGRLVSKPLIVGSLLAWYIVRLEKQHSFIISALVLAIAGDVCLLFENDFFFKAGLISFLLSHLCYWAYLKQFRDKTLSPTQKLLILIVAILAVIFNILLFKNAGPDRLYVILYSVVLLLMGTTAIRFPRLKNEISIIGIGAFIFILSDMTLSINKYLFSHEMLRYVVMGTYMIAQFLIIKGISDDASTYFELVNRKKK